MSSLVDIVDAGWAEDFGCRTELLFRPGVHLVRGGRSFQGYQAVYMARFESSIIVYAPPECGPLAKTVLASIPKDECFTPATAAHIAGSKEERVLGPSRHAFVDAAHFRPADKPAGTRLDVDDPMLVGLQAQCGEGEWAEAGFGHAEGLLYGLKSGDRLLAAGNMTMYRGHPADVGVIADPAQRGRGIARRLVTKMITDLLPSVGIIRYRALLTNLPSLAVADGLGFVSRGEDLVVRLG
jgi:GNAT superfamily N-acetyltransferase